MPEDATPTRKDPGFPAQAGAPLLDVPMAAGKIGPGAAERPARVPEWFPGWARGLADMYFSATTCLFVVHGNVHDLIRCPTDRGDAYAGLSEFLATQVFGSWDVVLHHDLARGLRPMAGGDSTRLQPMVQFVSARLGDPRTWPLEPERLLLLLDRFVEGLLVGDESVKRKSVAFLFDYSQYLAPAGDLEALGRGAGTNLVRFLGWAQNPYIKRVNMAFVLVADRLSELNERLVGNPHVAAIEVPLPAVEERRRFVRWFAERQSGGASFESLSDYSPDDLAESSSGLTLVNLNVLLSQASRSGARLDRSKFKALKKSLIERQCRGLLEFVEPSHTLDLVVGHEGAKARLREDSELILKGRLEAAPMGYLICGSVGTGKTFLAECMAGSVGIPCVKLRNFRSKYVGETEANLEQVLTVLRSLGPVVVIIDEADAALGDRQADGDSGTSSRVFSMIASQMGDTRYRGKIIWMLLTCRPDLLPIDLKRQGRAEVHIPLFYPVTEEEIAQMFLVMAKKNKSALRREDLPHVKVERSLSGADIESIYLAAHRRALSAGRQAATREDLEHSLSQFVPSTQGLEKEMQEIAAMLECTSLDFLPPGLREQVAAPGGRTRLQERLVAIRQLIEGGLTA